MKTETIYKDKKIQFIIFMGNNKFNKSLLFLLFLSTIVTSCVKESKKTILTKKDNLILKFPDSVLINEQIKGQLDYNLVLDTLKEQEIGSRYVFLHLTTESSKDLTLAEIKAMNHLTFEDTTNTGKFIFKTQFNSIGNRTFSASIEDIIVLKDSLPNKKVRIITKETNVSKNVIVKSAHSSIQKHL